MAEILALGISHYPPLSGHDDRMATILRRMLQNPELPPLCERRRDGRRACGRNGARTRAPLRPRRIVPLWSAGWRRRGPPWMRSSRISFCSGATTSTENFREDIIPPYCIAAHEKFTFSPRPDNVWGETDKTFELPGNRDAAKMLATRLIEQGFDTAYAYKPLHHPLGHAFTNAIFYLDYNRKGFHYPIVPFAVNCYGRKVVSQRGGIPVFDKPKTEIDFDPPAPTPWRLFDLGAATARILAESPYRVALLASSGWSHAFLTAKNHYLYPDRTADRQMYEHLRDGDYEAWRKYPAQAVEDSGQQEILNWMCLVGALSALERKPQETGFVDTWIFNSSKAFLIAPPG